MRVLILGFERFDSLEWNLCYTLNGMGIECKILDPYKDFPFYFRFRLQTMLRASKVLEDLFWKHFLKKLKGFKAELTISTLQHFPPEYVQRLKGYGLKPLIMWNPDPIYALFSTREYVLYGDYDLYIVEVPFIRDYLERMLHKPAICIPEGFNPDIHSPPRVPKPDAEKRGPDIVIAGTLYYERTIILEHLSHYELEVYGVLPRWLRTPLIKYHKKRYISGKEKAERFYASKICLNTIHYANIDGTNCRLFEIAGAGGFQIAEYRKAIPEYFEPDKEIVLYSSMEELKEKVAYYLEKPELRWKIARAGRERAMREHTWEHRIKTLLKYLRTSGLLHENL